MLTLIMRVNVNSGYN